ncbi:MAG: adenine deaminase [Candidatus Bathyarchaeia archaeon]
MFALTGKVVNLFDGKIRMETLYVEGEKIQAVGDFDLQVDRNLDYSDYYLLPGFMDAHIHIESSMLTPASFAELALPHGTTCLVFEPHEVANVCGVKGIEYMLKNKTPLRLFFTAPSCVPATCMETSGCELGAEEVRNLLKHPQCVGLAEVMSFPEVIRGNPMLLEKIRFAKEQGKIRDGHAPQLRGLNLCKYIAAGIQSDHECSSLYEAAEKLKLGMHIMIREGSAAKNLEALIKLAYDGWRDRCMLVSDDLHVGDLIEDGHLDRILRKAVTLGLDPIQAVRMVTLNPARYFGLEGLGALAPGCYADVVIVKDLKRFEVEAVFVGGVLVAENGKLTGRTEPTPTPPEVLSTVRIGNLSVEDLKLKSESRAKVRVIRLIPNEIVTGSDVALLEARDGFLVPDTEHDVLPLVVVERHRMSGNLGRGFVSGFGLKSGALASTVAHDSHNCICIGASYEDMLVAVNELKKIGGGLVAVRDGAVLAEVELPIAGLMSDKSPHHIKEGLSRLHAVAKELGCPLQSPFMALSFLSLPVIPELKLTDKGLVDVNNFRMVDLFL